MDYLDFWYGVRMENKAVNYVFAYEIKQQSVTRRYVKGKDVNSKEIFHKSNEF